MMPEFKLFTLDEAERTLPLVRRPLLRAAVRSLGRRADGVSRVSRPATKHAQRSAVLSK